MTDTLTSESIFAARARLREALVAAGGVRGLRTAAASVSPHIEHPFGTATPVEGTEIRAVQVKKSEGGTLEAGFLDGIQRFTVEGWVGIVPVIRAYTAAAVLQRVGDSLVPAEHHEEEFVVAPLEHLPPDLASRLQEVGLPVYDCAPAERQHPLVDVQRAVDLVDRRRRAGEEAVGHRFKEAFPDVWLVVDGALRGFASVDGASRLLGVIKSHETQFLAGVDLEVALTLEEGHRTTVFDRNGVNGDPVYSWYVRLWDRSDHDILYGLIRLERPQLEDVVRSASRVSALVMAERAPIASREARWDRLLYPMHEVESYLWARAGGWL